MRNVDITSLLDQASGSRKLRAYAYLTASFNAPQSKTKDVVDCLIPFVAAGISEQAGHFLELDKLSNYLRLLGLRVPLYALQQLVPRLQDLGLIEWNNPARRYICNAPTTQQPPALRNETGLEDAFQTFEDDFKAYAQGFTVLRPPFSSSWSEALIAFLRSETAGQVIRAISIKDTLLLDTPGIETYLVARFIQEVQTTKSPTFDAIVEIYTGILIEDFINNIQSIGDTRTFNNLKIYYDTTVLLRLLGTSGSQLLTATMEMHRALEDLGCKCHYLEYTVDEVSRILDSIVLNHESGEEIHGETSEAISLGEISIGAIRDIKATFEQRLGELNIFPTIYNYQVRKSEDIYQISEDSLISAIESEAIKRERIYKRSSAVTDARSVGIVMRLRKGVSRRDIQACSHLFVSHNSLFQTAVRTFVRSQVEGYDSGQIPPVLTLGQITTVAWLATAKTLEPVKVTKELLATCYNAVRPGPNWTQQFSLALAGFRNENPGFIEDRANAALFLQLARNTARDESLNQPTVLRKANLAAIFAAAAQESDAKQREREAELIRLAGDYQAKDEQREAEAAARQAQIARETQEIINHAEQLARDQQEELARRHETDKLFAIKAAGEQAANEAVARQRDEARQHRTNVSTKIAHGATIALRIILSFVFTIFFFLVSIDYWKTGSTTKILIDIVLAALFLFTNIDFMGIEVVKIPVRAIEYKLASWLFKLFYGLDP